MRRIESSFQFLFSPLSIGTFCYSMHEYHAMVAVHGKTQFFIRLYDQTVSLI